MRSRQDLIRALADELRPTPHLFDARAAAAMWLVVCAAFVAAATLATGPLRPGVAQELAHEPRLAIDLLLGLAAGGSAMLAAMRLRVPSLVPAWRRAAPALALLLGWGALQLLALYTLEGTPSMLGKRGACALEVLLFSALPLFAGLVVAARAAPLERAWLGGVVGIAAGALAAVAMQVACMDDPLHALTWHLAPVLVVAGAGALLGRLALRRI